MLFQIALALFLGILAGTISGLLPGIHINLIGAILVSLSISIFASINPIYFVVFITAMAITHTFVDFIPSVFLGCPDADTSLSVLPGHELLKQGKGYEAVYLTALGGLFSIFILILIAYPSVIIVPKIYSYIQALIPYLLISISIFMIFSQKNKFSSLLVYSLCGVLGLIVLNVGLEQPLLPLLTGLFGSSALLLSIKQKTQIPKQEINKKIKISPIKPLTGSAFASFICGFLPGLGSGEAAVLGNIISKTDRKGFLFLLGSINTLVMGLSFIAFYTISKTRTGVVVSIQQLVGDLKTNLFVLILIVIFFSGIISFFLTLFLAKLFLRIIEKINYTKLSVFVLGFVSIIILIFSGISGFMIFLISTFTGIYCISLNVRRTTMMACLILPTIVLYLSF